MTLKIINKHIYANDITAICQPLFAYWPIHYFHHVRTFTDGSRISLSNHQAWCEHYYARQYYNQPAIDKRFAQPFEQNERYILWPLCHEHPVFADLRNFNVYQGITLIKQKNNYCDYFYFGSAFKEDNILNFFINRLDLLKRFIFYFLEQANSIIKTSEKNRIYLPNKKVLVPPLQNQNFKKLIHETRIKKFYLDHTYLTEKEVSLLQCWLKGKTAKEMARIFKISPRTIESNFERIKNKLQCKSKMEMIEKLFQLGILSFRE